MAKSPQQIVGDRIATLRHMHEMTQERLAELCFVTQVAVSQWERGVVMPHRSRQFKVADALRTDRSMLFREILEPEAAA